VTGNAGTGKTRLAVQVARRLARYSEWEPVWVRPGMAGLAIPAAAGRGRPVLVILDDAANDVDGTVDVLTALAATPADAAVRVLLLARDSGRWWAEVLNRGGWDDADLAEDGTFWGRSAPA
jgi:hypothetical protein